MASAILAHYGLLVIIVGANLKNAAQIREL
jgi:hypothetical protein